jgi:uncharacterized membrane protein YkvA (DUF1232 family)
VLRSVRKRTRDALRNPEQLKILIDAASKKGRHAPRGWLADLWTQLKAMIRLIRAYWNNTYRDVSPSDLATIIFAVMYFVMPFDLIPDWIPVAGYIDDAYIVTRALRTVKDALDRFLLWEKEQAVQQQDARGTPTEAPTV